MAMMWGQPAPLSSMLPPGQPVRPTNFPVGYGPRASQFPAPVQVPLPSMGAMTYGAPATFHRDLAQGPKVKETVNPQSDLTENDFNMILPNRVDPSSHYLPKEVRYPTIHPTATIRNSKVRGDVRIGPEVHIVSAKLRADEGTPFYIGARSNIQSHCLLHGHFTQKDGQPVYENLVQVPGKGYFSIYIGEEVTLAHGATVHGPVKIDDQTFIGFNATIDHATIGKNVEIGPHAYIGNVTIPDNTAIAPGAVITKPEDIAKYIVPKKGLNPRIVEINRELGRTYWRPNMNMPTGGSAPHVNWVL